MHIIKNKRPLNWRPLDFFQMRDPVGIRTQDPQLRRLLLYPTELPDHQFAAAKILNYFETYKYLAKKMLILDDS